MYLPNPLYYTSSTSFCHFALYLMERCVILIGELHEISEIIKDFTQSIWKSDKSGSHRDKQASRIIASGEIKSMTGDLKSRNTFFKKNHNNDNSFWKHNAQQHLYFASLALKGRQ